MNRKGFTLIELIATLLVLSLVVGITVYSVSGIFKNTKDKTEDVFVETIKDSLEVYLTSKNAKGLNFDTTPCSRTLNKTHGNRKVYKAVTTFQSVIDSEYKPITQKDLVNPANEKMCDDASNIIINVYRDQDYVYYYSVDKDEFNCLTKSEIISNLPEGFVC